MIDLTNTQILSIEIGDDCNLKGIHEKCPINYRVPNDNFGTIDIDDIVKTIRAAQMLNFKGVVAFHYYNEPLLYLDKILTVIDKVKDADYILWTNGVLLEEDIEKNNFLDKFKYVVITCYFQSMLPKFNKLKERYNNIEIKQWDLDDRGNIYVESSNNIFGCQRPIGDIPIDYWGNVHLCCMDWNNTYQIGNIKSKGFKEIIEGDEYQRAADAVYKNILNRVNCPDICKKCRTPFLMPEIADKLRKRE